MPPSGETMRQTPNSFRDARTCPRSPITMPSLVRLGFQDRGRFVVVHQYSTLSDCCQLTTTLNAEVKNPQNCFLPTEGDRINRSIRNLAHKRIPWVCYSTPHLALIVKRGSVQERPKVSKFAQNCGFWPPGADTMNTFR